MNALALQDNPLISPEAAAKWFLHDMAEVSGFLSLGFQNMSPLSVYASYRPILTQPDPWYYAGVVALEVSAVTDLFMKDGADDILRAVFEQMDGMIGRDNDDASQLTMLLLGRLGIGSVLMGRRVPENMMSRIMLLLLGSEKNAKKIMPDDGAQEQLRAALKSGKPVWWKMFARRYRLTTAPDSAIASRLTIQVTNNRDRHLPTDLPTAAQAGPTQAERLIKLEALRVALQEAEIAMPAPSNDGEETETFTDNTPADHVQGPVSEDEVLVGLNDGVSGKTDDGLPLDDGTLSLEGYRVD
ncbi:MAG: hypothetical protein JNM81_04245 [Rhodospirillaceae bacterium]|nr:hypothetical protein [Rhodospirillaceae bacterium]